MTRNDLKCHLNLSDFHVAGPNSPTITKKERDKQNYKYTVRIRYAYDDDQNSESAAETANTQDWQRSLLPESDNFRCILAATPASKCADVLGNIGITAHRSGGT